MANDIVDVLRNAHGNDCTCYAHCAHECGCDADWSENYTTQAADEIERLRNVITNLSHLLTSQKEKPGKKLRALEIDHQFTKIILQQAEEEIERLRTQLNRRNMQIEAIRKAIQNEGPQPRYHRTLMRKHRREWKTLWKAIDNILTS